MIDWHRWKASEGFPHDQAGKGLELMVEGLYGPHSRRWIRIRSVWHGNGHINFSLLDGYGWIAMEPDTVIETKMSISY